MKTTERGSLLFCTTLSKTLLDYLKGLVTVIRVTMSGLLARLPQCFGLLQPAKVLDYPFTLLWRARHHGVVHFLDDQYQSIGNRSIVLIVQFLYYPIPRSLVATQIANIKSIDWHISSYFTSFLSTANLFLHLFLPEEREISPLRPSRPCGEWGERGRRALLRTLFSPEKTSAATFHGARLHALA